MWNDMDKMSAKDLKKVAESMWLVKWEDFKSNASAKDMLELINSQNNDDSSDDITDIPENKSGSDGSDPSDKELIIENEEIDNEYEVVTPVKRNGKLLKKWNNIKYFEWIDSLIKDWIVKISE